MSFKDKMPKESRLRRKLELLPLTAIVVLGIGVPARETHGTQFPNAEKIELEARRIHVVRMTNESPFYSPAELQIRVGDIVRWVNGETSDAHTVYERSGALISPDLNAGDEWCFQFSREGTYEYKCRFHPWMRGVVTVDPRRAAVEEFDLPEEFHGPGVQFIRSGAQPWMFQHQEGGLLARVTSGGVVESWRLSSAAPSDLRTVPSLIPLSGADETIWFFDAATRELVSFNPASVRLSRHKPVKLTVPVLGGTMAKNRLWLIEKSSNCVAAYDLETGETRKFVLPESARLVSLDISLDGAVWLLDQGRNKIVKLHNEWMTEYTIPTAFSIPRDLAIDRHDTVWFSESAAHRLGRFRDGQFDEFAISIANSAPAALCTDAEGNLWFISEARNKLMRVATKMLQPIESADPGLQPCSSSTTGAEHGRAGTH